MKDRPTVLISESDHFAPSVLRSLAEVAHLEVADLDRPGLLRAVPPIDLLWVRLRHRIDQEVLDAAPHLGALATATTGLTHLDLPALEARSVTVLSLKGETAFLDRIRATAEHTLLLMLALLRHLPAATEHARGGGWDRDRFRGGELNGRTVGLIGYGRLGRMVGALCSAFGARVLATDPRPGAPDPRVERVDLATLLAQADLISLHVAYEVSTHHLLGPAEFRAMRPGTLLVNTSRGEVVDEVALLAALDAGHLGAAALDVLHDERSTGMAHHPLVRRAQSDRRLLLTPHLGGATFESMQRTEEFLAGKVLAWLTDPQNARSRRRAGAGGSGSGPQ